MRTRKMKNEVHSMRRQWSLPTFEIKRMLLFMSWIGLLYSRKTKKNMLGVQWVTFCIHKQRKHRCRICGDGSELCKTVYYTTLGNKHYKGYKAISGSTPG